MKRFLLSVLFLGASIGMTAPAAGMTWNSLKEKSFFERSSYFSGVADGYFTGMGLHREKPLICLPKNINALKLMAQIEIQIADYPDRWDENLALNTLSSWRGKWPCK